MIGEKVLKGKSTDVWRRLNRDVTPAGKPERGRGAVRGADRAWSGARTGRGAGAFSTARCERTVFCCIASALTGGLNPPWILFIIVSCLDY